MTGHFQGSGSGSLGVERARRMPVCCCGEGEGPRDQGGSLAGLLRSGGLAVLGVHNRPTLPGDQTARPWFPKTIRSAIYMGHTLSGPSAGACMMGLVPGCQPSPKSRLGSGYGTEMAERYTGSVTGWDGGALGSDKRGKKEG